MGDAPEYWQDKPRQVEMLQKIRDNDESMVEVSAVCDPLNHGGAVAVAEALCLNKTVKKVEMIMCEVDDAGAVALAKVLRTPTWCVQPRRPLRRATQPLRPLRRRDTSALRAAR
jgi:hypothetical protein